LYTGKPAQFHLEKTVLCVVCEGRGCRFGAVATWCTSCSGTGVTYTIRQLGIGLVQQLQQTCPQCNGTGEVVQVQDRCMSCGGRKIIDEKKILQVYIEKGMKHGQKIVFHGEADQNVDLIPGDVLIVLQQKEHSIFRREGDDLHIEKKKKLHFSKP